MPYWPPYPFKNPLKRFFAAVFDAVGRLLFAPLRWFRQPAIHPEAINKILVIRLDQLGDVVMTQPALLALRRRFPHAEIDLLAGTQAAALFQDARSVRRVIAVRHHWFNPSSRLLEIWTEFRRILPGLRKAHYDLAIDFRGDFRHILLMLFAGIPLRLGYGLTGGGFFLTHERVYPLKKHQVEVNMDLLAPLGITGEARLEPFTYSDVRKQRFWNWAGQKLTGNLHPRILVHVGAGREEKRWPAVNYQDLVRQLSEIRLGHIILIGTESEKKDLKIDFDPARVLDLRGQTALDDLPVLFDSCNLYIGNDSGPAHLAAAQGLPIVSIFCSVNDPAVWKPWTSQITVLPMEKTGVDDVVSAAAHWLGSGLPQTKRQR